MALKDFTPEDKAALRDMVRLYRERQTPSRLILPSEQVPAAPPFYIARVTSTLDVLTQNAVTGTGTGAADLDTPGNLVCDIYRINASGDLEAYAISRTVYNVSATAITVSASGDAWVPIARTAGGKWITACCALGGPPNCSCGCECDACQPITSYAGCEDVGTGSLAQLNAPCCWKVDITGIVVNTCTSCESLNNIYFLRQASSCLWTSASPTCADCDPTTITLEVLTNAGSPATYTIRVTLDTHVWQRDFASNPICCQRGSISLLDRSTIGTGSDDCDATSSGCVVTAQFSDPDDPPTCPQICVDVCSACIGTPTAEVSQAIQVVIAGVVDGSCTDTSVLNGTFICEYIGAVFNLCTWRAAKETTDPCANLANVPNDFWRWQIDIELFGGDKVLIVKIDTAGGNGRSSDFCHPGFRLEQTELFDCDGFVNLDVPFSTAVPGETDGCDVTGVTCTLTGL